jgi:hypothetical protein
MSSRKFLVPANLLNLAEDPAVGESGDIYFNTVSDKLKIYDGSAWVEVGSSSGSQTTVSDTAPLTPNIGDSWYNNETGSLYVYDGTYWVEVNGIIEGTNTFSHISVAGQSQLVADSITDVLTFVAGTNVSITTNATTDSITINSAGDYSSVDSITYPDYISFDTSPETIPTQTGSIYWDSGDGLPATVLNANVTIGLGQEQVALVKNESGSSIAKGKVVYISGAQGQRPTITLSDADAESTSSKTFGLTSETIANGAEGFVTTFGVLRGVNTLGLTQGAPLWLSSTAGGYTTTVPPEPAHSVFIGYVVKAHQTAGEIFVNIQNGYELDELHGVSINGVSEDQTLRYDDASGLWKNTHPNIITAKNATESTIAAFTPVYINTQEFDQDNVTFVPADAATSMYLAKLPADAITVESVLSNNSTKLVTMGVVSGLNLTGYSLGQLLYIGVGGGLTSTRPTGTNAIQPFARVLSTDNGTIYVYGNTFVSSIDTLPNLASDKIWLGTSGRPVETTLNTSVVPEGTNLYFTDEKAQDAAASMITGGAHNGVSVEYVDSSGIFNFTNTGVTALYGTTNEISVSGSTGGVTIGIPDSPVFVTPNIGAATATSLVVNGATVKTTTTTLTSASPTTIATFSPGDGALAIECLVLVSSLNIGAYTTSKILLAGDVSASDTVDITEYAIIEKDSGSGFIDLTLSADTGGGNILLKATVTNYNGVTVKVVSTSIQAPLGAS